MWNILPQRSFAAVWVPDRGDGMRGDSGRAGMDPPPIDCFSNQFLFYLNSNAADTYQTWSRLVHPEIPKPIAISAVGCTLFSGREAF